MIILKNVTKAYQLNGDASLVLDHVNLHVQEGEMRAVMGRSGCGKSTLLNIAGGLTTPLNGEVWIGGSKLDFTRRKELLAIRRNYIGYVVQNFALISRKTVFENVILPVRTREYAKNNYARVKLLLEELGIADKAHKYPQQLSNGEKQRVAIARALVDEKRIILADEPTGALDYENAENVILLLKRLSQEKGITMLVATHDWEIANKCDRVSCIVYGKIEDACCREKI